MEGARQAAEAKAQRYCIVISGRSPLQSEITQISNAVRQIKNEIPIQICCSLGLLNGEQASQLKDAGVDRINHNLNTSRRFYPSICTTHGYQDRLDTLEAIRAAGMEICCGGIVGMGEEQTDRVGLLLTLANLDHHPESVPVNLLVKIEGTPLANTEELDVFEFIRCIAVARILMPRSLVRLSAGRQSLSDEAQAMCYLAGANSIFYGERLLTTDNPEADDDRILFERLGLYPMQKEDETGKAPAIAAVMETDATDLIDEQQAVH